MTMYCMILYDILEKAKYNNGKQISAFQDWGLGR